MAVIQFTGGVNSALRVQAWAKQLWHTHQRDQFFFPFTGKGANKIVQLKVDFTTKAGYQMTEGLRMPFEGAGVANDEELEGNEEAPDFHSMTWTVAQLRNAGRIAGMETAQQVKYNLPTEIRDGLGDWMAETRDEDIFTAIAVSPSKIFYRNDRTGTGTVVATDLMVLSEWSRAKVYAKSSANPKLPPIKIRKVNGKAAYRYLGVMHDHCAYDLEINDATYQQVARDAGMRGKSNPLFEDALIDWGGVTLHAHDNVPIFTTWGTGAIAGAENYLLGRQACIVGMGGYRIQGKNGFLKWVDENSPLEQECSLNNEVNSGNTLVYADDYEIREAA